MRSGHLVRAWQARLAWTVLCVGMCVTTVRAQSPVVYAGLDDSELFARIRGQTRDLPITLISDAAATVSRPSATQLQRLAREHQAELVVSVDREANGSHSVYVFDARSSELRVRTAPAPDRKNRFARSAAAETVALIVRGELSDALAARASQPSPLTPSTTPPSGRAGPTSTREPSTGTATRPATTPKPEPARRPVVAATRPTAPKKTEIATPPDEQDDEAREEPESSFDDGSAWLGPAQLSIELAARISTAIDGRYFLGAAVGTRLSFKYVSFGVTGSTTLADRAEIQGLTLSLREHSVGIDALAHLPLTAAIRVSFGAAGRLLFYRRTAASGDSDWNPEPANTSTTLAVGPQAELRWQLIQHLGVSIRIGLDVLLRPVSWRYRLDTNPRLSIELERQNRTEPWLAVGVYGNL